MEYENGIKLIEQFENIRYYRILKDLKQITKFKTNSFHFFVKIKFFLHLKALGMINDDDISVQYHDKVRYQLKY
jgi:hypothetical protein